MDIFVNDLGKQMLARLSEEMKKIRFKQLLVMIVERSNDHPLRTNNYFDERKLLENLGYRKTKHVTLVPWTTNIGNNQTKYQDNPMRLWVADLKS